VNEDRINWKIQILLHKFSFKHQNAVLLGMLIIILLYENKMSVTMFKVAYYWTLHFTIWTQSSHSIYSQLSLITLSIYAIFSRSLPFWCSDKILTWIYHPMSHVITFIYGEVNITKLLPCNFWQSCVTSSQVQISSSANFILEVCSSLMMRSQFPRSYKLFGSTFLCFSLLLSVHAFF
jgi:hypothetical protein